MMEKMLNEICDRYSSVEESSLIKDAYNIASESLREIKRSNNRPFIEHPLMVAHILSCEIGLMSEAVIALFLHEASRVRPEILDEPHIVKKFSVDHINMAKALNKISRIRPLDTKLEADRYRKLIASYSTDPRVFLIKLADRLEIMRSLPILPKADQQRKNAETILLYVPLAHQTGLYKTKQELEDLWLKYAEPEKYRAITNRLKATERDREKLMAEFVNPLKEKLNERGIKYKLKARTKSAYSIWKKMNKQGVSFDQIYDIFAMRFIIDAPADKEHDLCWEVYSLVTEEYEPDTKRLRDWITCPKENGYESLHTTVKNSRGNYMEVQIRTERMDYVAEVGFAAHWSYKGVKRDDSLQDWLANVRRMMEVGSQSEYQHVSQSVLQDVFVFTPNGELKQLKGGATVLDFAFHIHSNIGLKCTGAKIGGKMVSIREPLKTGDIVEVLTSKNQRPTSDWLNYVVTSKARNKIRQRLQEEEFKAAKMGKELLERRLNNWKLEIDDSDITYLVKKYKYKTINEFYSALGTESLDVTEIKNYILEEKDSQKSEYVQREVVHKQSSDSDYLIIGDNRGLKGLDYKMAKCCNPVFGDDVFGFVTINDGVKIHRMSCPNAERLLTNYPHRVQKVKWKESNNVSSFQTTLKIVVDDESGINSVLSTITQFKASVRSFNTSERMRERNFELVATIFVSTTLELDKIIASVRKLRDVKQVTRQ